MFKHFSKIIFFIFLSVKVITPQSVSPKDTILNYGGNEDFYPFEFLDNSGNPSGFIIDLLKEVEKETGIKFNVELLAWNKIIDNLNKGKKYNLTSLYYSQERDEFLEFGTPFLITYDDLFIRKTEKRINDINDLRGKKVLVEKGGFIEQYFKQNFSQLELIPVDGESNAVKLLNSGSYDAAVVNYYSGIANIKRFNLNNIYSKSIPFVPREYGFAVRQGDDKLLSTINKSLASIKQKGIYDDIYKKWFIYDEDTEKYYNYFYAAGVTALILIFFAFLFLLWNRTLKHEVNRKTLQISEELEKRKIIEKELIAAKEESERLSQIKSEFISQISHEIRTPINTIIKGFEFLKEEVLTNEDQLTQSLVDSIKSATKRLIRTIDLIVNFSEVKIGIYKMNRKLIDVEKDIIDVLIKEFNMEAREKGLEIIKTTKAENCKVEIDEYSVMQIFSNLIDNAIKFTKTGKVELIIDKDENKLSVSVKDSGSGMSGDFMKVLFTPFAQAEQGYSRSYDGTGLGLSLAHRYCQLNNAEIYVESELAKGSTFTVKFN